MRDCIPLRKRTRRHAPSFACAAVALAGALLTILLLALPSPAVAQQPGHMRIVGSLAFGATRPDDPIYH